MWKSEKKYLSDPAPDVSPNNVADGALVHYTKWEGKVDRLCGKYLIGWLKKQLSE